MLGFGFSIGTNHISGAGAVSSLANTVLPVITGTPEIGQALSVSNGTWTGTATTDDGRTRALDGIQGFAEECRARW